MPRGQRRVGQQPGRERRRVHDTDALGLQIRHEVGQHRVLQRVVVVRQDHVQVGAVEDVPEEVHRIAADADESHLALLLDLAAGPGSVSSTIVRHVDEFDVVAQHDVEVIDAHAAEG